MSLQEEINKINERIEALNKDVKSLVNELDAVMENEFPQDDEKYWYVDDDAEVMEIEWYDSEYGRGRLSIGNVFRTKEQAEFVVEKLMVEAELRKFSRPFVDGEENNHIKYSPSFGELSVLTSFSYQDQGVIYFESSEKLQQAIEAVGEERIIKYIFGEEG